jgi:hypothetical protein
MNPVVVVVLVGIGVAALVWVIVSLTKRAAANRRAALDTIAGQAGWSFSGDTVKPETLAAGKFPLFTHGHAKKASNVMRIPGTDALISIFDYQYTVGGGQHQNTVVQTVVYVALPGVSLPPFVLSPENILHKVGGVLGYHDIDFDSNPEFSKKYLLRSKEAEGRVRDVFTPSVRVYFEQRAPLTVEGSASGLLVYRQGRRVKPEDLLAFVEDSRSVARQFER